MTIPRCRGRLTDSDRERIRELADQGLSAGRISHAIRRHPSTVSWFMYTDGLKAPRRANSEVARVYMRNGREVRSFTPLEDQFIETKRKQGSTPREIADLVNTQFQSGRTHHTIRCRLVMLAAREDS